MNETEVITHVRDAFTGIRTTTPSDQIARRGRAVRARRRIAAVATAALAAGAAAAVFAATQAPAGHLPVQPGNAQLAAWTVTKQADGTVRVTIRELMDPAGLQAKLRAAGVPASVTDIGARNSACRPYPASEAQLAKVFTTTATVLHPATPTAQANTPQQAPGLVIVLLIHPAALPAGTGVQIAASFGPVISQGTVVTQTGTVRRPTLVYASPLCTGGTP